MERNDFDFICKNLSADEVRQLHKALKDWCSGDENSFPVQLALLTRAQWRAAAQVPVQMKQSLELLDQKLVEYRQQTGTLLKSFNAAVNTKTEELKGSSTFIVGCDFRTTTQFVAKRQWKVARHNVPGKRSIESHVLKGHWKQPIRRHFHRPCRDEIYLGWLSSRHFVSGYYPGVAPRPNFFLPITNIEEPT